MPIEVRRRFAGWIVESRYPLPELPESTGTPDWRVTADAGVLRRRSAAWYQQFMAADGLPWVWYGRSGTDDVLRFPGLGVVVIRPVARDIACYWRRHLEAGVVEHLLINHVLPLAASNEGRIVLHASVVARPGGGAVAFVGPVGAGKSTIAGYLASRGWPIVSDDRLIVNREHMALPVAPYLRLLPEAAARLGFDAPLPEGHHKVRVRVPLHEAAAKGVPLERVVILKLGAGPVRFERLTGGMAVRELLGALLQLGLDSPGAQRRVFDEVATLVDAVPCDHLVLAHDWPQLADAERLLGEQP